MSVQDDLVTAANDLETLKAVLTQAAADLGNEAPASPADNVLASLVQTLTDNGYTVTAPNDTPEETPEQ